MRAQSLLRYLPVVLIVTACSAADESEPPPGQPLFVKVLTANIGNPDKEDPNYALRLSDQLYEDHVAAAIQALDLDVVFLQEVLPPTACEAFSEADPARTCFDIASRQPPVRRILGPDYSIVCDGRDHVECMGVHTRLGTIEGVEPGGFALSGATTPALPLAECSYFEGQCSNAYCDGESTVSAVDVITSRGPIRIVHAHPNAPGEGADGFYDGEPCRYLQLEQIFKGNESLAGTTPPVLIAGDFNMDPEGFASQREADMWNELVGPDKRFSDLGPPRDEGGRYLPTRLIFAIDHVIGEGFSGACKVHSDQLDSEDPNVRPPLDDGFDFSQLPGGLKFPGRIDHASISCELTVEGL